MTTNAEHLPPGWCVTNLGSLGRYLNGRGFKKAEWSSDGRPIIRIQNLTGSSTQFNYFEGDVDPKHEVKRGDLLMSWAATLGAYVWTGPSAVLNQHIFKVDSFIAPDFHFYALRWALEELYRNAHGTGMVHVTKRKFDSNPVSLPPANEQHRIVEAIESYFTRIDDAVATLERVQRNLKRYRASALKAAVEGRLVPTEAELARAEGRDYEPASVLLERILAERRRRWEEAELAKMKTKGKTPKEDRWKARYKEPVTPATSELPTLPDGWCWVSFDQLFTTVSDGGKKLAQRDYLPDGEFPVVDQGAQFIGGYTNDECLRYTGPLPVVVFGDHTRAVKLILHSFVVGADGVKLVAPSPDILPAFAEMLVATRSLPDKGYARHFQYLRAAAFPLAPFAEQRRLMLEVERHLSNGEAVESQARATVMRCGRLRQSILKWAFEGNLVDQDATDEPATALLERIQTEREAAASTAKTKKRGRRKARSTEQ